MSENTQINSRNSDTDDSGSRPAGNNQGQRNNNRRNRRNGPRPSPTFKGNTEGTNSHVFQLIHERESKQQFGKTVEMMYEYVVKEFDYASDLA